MIIHIILQPIKEKMLNSVLRAWQKNCLSPRNRFKPQHNRGLPQGIASRGSQGCHREIQWDSWNSFMTQILEKKPSIESLYPGSLPFGKTLNVCLLTIFVNSNERKESYSLRRRKHGEKNILPKTLFTTTF